MNLKEANKQLEKLENDYDYYLKEKEEILSLVMPVATDIRKEKVDGGKRSDRLLEYAEKMDIKKIDETLNYIFKKKQNLINWIENELKIMFKYGEVEAIIIQSFCRNVYRKYKKKRDID